MKGLVQVHVRIWRARRPLSSKAREAALCSTVVLGLTCLLLPLVWWLALNSQQLGPGPTLADGGAKERKAVHDCDDQFEAWQKWWSNDKQGWCCQTAGRACPPTSTTTTTTLRPGIDAFDCEADWESWKVMWTESKKGWCCHVKGRGCPPPGPPEAGHHGLVLPPSRQGLSPPLRLQRLSAVVASPMMPGVAPGTAQSREVTVSRAFDCAKSLSTWERSWSTLKKDWCCGQIGKGCTTIRPTTPALFDCRDGFANWQVRWPQAKADWCCKTSGKGCANYAQAPSFSRAATPLAAHTAVAETTEVQPTG